MHIEHKKYQNISIASTSKLISDLKRRDESALLLVYDKYAPTLFTFISKIVSDRKLSEEVLEKTFERMVLDINSFNEVRDDFYIWLLNISRTEAIETLIVSRSTQVALTMQMGCMRSIPIQKFILLLDPIEKTIFSLMYYRRFSVEEVSEILKVRVELVKLKVQAAYKKLQYIYPNPHTVAKEVAQRDLAV